MDKLLHDPKDPKLRGIMVYSLSWVMQDILSINSSSFVSLSHGLVSDAWSGIVRAQGFGPLVQSFGFTLRVQRTQ